MTQFDEHAQPPPGLHAENRAERDLAEMLGLAKGVLFDGVVSREEAAALHTWLDAHPAIATEWPGEILAKRLRRIFEDGEVTEEERTDLQELLETLVGKGGGSIGGIPTSSDLPLDRPPPLIEIPNRTFVLTGRFALGPRRACEEEVRAVGGWCEPGVTKRTDFVVIGTFASRDWKHGSLGTKIEKAVDYRKRFGRLRIIGEDHWAKAI